MWQLSVPKIIDNCPH